MKIWYWALGLLIFYCIFAFQKMDWRTAPRPYTIESTEKKLELNLDAPILLIGNQTAIKVAPKLQQKLASRVNGSERENLLKQLAFLDLNLAKIKHQVKTPFEKMASKNRLLIYLGGEAENAEAIFKSQDANAIISNYQWLQSPPTWYRRWMAPLILQSYNIQKISDNHLQLKNWDIPDMATFFQTREALMIIYEKELEEFLTKAISGKFIPLLLTIPLPYPKQAQKCAEDMLGDELLRVKDFKKSKPLAYNDQLHFWQKLLEKSPLLPLAHARLFDLYQENQLIAQALSHLKKYHLYHCEHPSSLSLINGIHRKLATKLELPLIEAEHLTTLHPSEDPTEQISQLIINFLQEKLSPL